MYIWDYLKFAAARLSTNAPHRAYRSSVRWLFLPLTVDGLGAAADVSQRDAFEGTELLANFGNQITRVATTTVTTTTACIVITAALHNV